MVQRPLAEQSAAFLSYLDEWMGNLPTQPFAKVFNNPQKTVVICVDIIKGFTKLGPLSSPRIQAVVEPIAQLFRRAWDAGVRNFILSQDAHDPQAIEFSAFPQHCVRGSEEAETVDAFRALPFFDRMTIIEKNSISSMFSPGLYPWIKEHREVDTFIIVGACTDLCVNQLAMEMRLDGNAHQLARRVIVPANCVATYDRPVEAAREQGGTPHDAELLSAVALYHMALNRITVLQKIV